MQRESESVLVERLREQGCRQTLFSSEAKGDLKIGGQNKESVRKRFAAEQGRALERRVPSCT